MSAGIWFSLLLTALKLAGALINEAGASRRANETNAAALGRTLDDALQTLDKAKKARADAASRDAGSDGLQQPDGWQRD